MELCINFLNTLSPLDLLVFTNFKLLKFLSRKLSRKNFLSILCSAEIEIFLIFEEFVKNIKLDTE